MARSACPSSTSGRAPRRNVLDVRAARRVRSNASRMSLSYPYVVSGARTPPRAAGRRSQYRSRRGIRGGSSRGGPCASWFVLEGLAHRHRQCSQSVPDGSWRTGIAGAVLVAPDSDPIQSTESPAQVPLHHMSPGTGSTAPLDRRFDIQLDPVRSAGASRESPAKPLERTLNRPVLRTSDVTARWSAGEPDTQEEPADPSASVPVVRRSGENNRP